MRREEECKRISLELHDAMGQTLTAIGFNLSYLRNDIPDSCLELLDDIVSIVDDMSNQVRNLSHDLRPIMLDDLGLIPTLRWFLNSFTRRTKIKTKLEAVEFDEYRNENLEITIYRIVQEALNNVAKHAEAKNVKISLKREITRITGFIQDDGKGFDINKIFKEIGEKHIGLINMRERVSILGGTLKIQSENGKGTRININIPC
ncbi:MAG: sensor histidine kinase [Proteobacteria bacterium]|nr:sensor histidine kinase [Pseudomonadota bacterium]MBU1697908.1 sensor histidine kinase [Pseudomonadota bacterium]